MNTAAATVTKQEISVCDAIKEAIESTRFDPSVFLGKQIRIHGGNFIHDTSIARVEILFTKVYPKDMERSPRLENVLLYVADTEVSVNKKRWKLKRIIRCLSWTHRINDGGHIVVIFEQDGWETLKDYVYITFLD